MKQLYPVRLALLIASVSLTIVESNVRRQDDYHDHLDAHIHNRPDHNYKVCVDLMRPCLPFDNDCCEGLHCTNYGGTFCVYDIQMCVCTAIKENEEME